MDMAVQVAIAGIIVMRVDMLMGVQVGVEMGLAVEAGTKT